MQAEWLQEGVLAYPEAEIVEAFGRVEEILGSDWIEKRRASGIVGASPTLGIVSAGRALAALFGVRETSRLIEKLRDEQADAWARNRSNVSRQILQPAIKRANEQRAKDGLAAIEGVTNHSLRRTFASLLYEAGATPAYVMSQMGHESSALALEVYAKVMERKRDTGARMDELIRGADWAAAVVADERINRFDPEAVRSGDST